MTNDREFMPLTQLSDEELLRTVYFADQHRTTLEIELAARLAQALDQLAVRPTGVDDFVSRLEQKLRDRYGTHP